MQGTKQLKIFIMDLKTDFETYWALFKHEARKVVAEKHEITEKRVYIIVKWFFNQARKRRKYDFLQKFAPLEEH